MQKKQKIILKKLNWDEVLGINIQEIEELHRAIKIDFLEGDNPTAKNSYKFTFFMSNNSPEFCVAL